MSVEKIQDPGFGENSSHRIQQRMVKNNGDYNVLLKGTKYSTKDIYIYLTKMSWKFFLSIITLAFLLINLFFACIYVGIGEEAILGASKNDWLNHFWHAYFFSCQTFTTVGYGLLAPQTFTANAVAAIEVFIGLLWFAVITGLLYARFSRPTTRIAFSKNIIIAPYKNIKALELRVVNERQSPMREVNADLILSINELREDNSVHRNYYNLQLERKNILFFPLSWTIVHPIDEVSPFFNKTKDEVLAMDIELFVFLKGYDDTFTQTIPTSHSYLSGDLVWGARFVRNFHTAQNGQTVLQIDKNDAIEAVNLA